MLIVIPQVLPREEALALGRELAAAEWVDGNVTSGGGAALAKNNRQLPENGDAAARGRAAVQRALSDHNMTFKEAIEVTRRNLAEMYLQQRQLPLTEIALLLGYSELSAFSRAFTRWTGTSPRHYRQAQSGH